MVYQSFITKNPYLEKASIIIGVSGGVDSMVLLQLCIQAGLKIYVVHVNYGLRGSESDADQALVEAYCSQYGIECRVVTVAESDLKGKGINLQDAARHIRYAAFQTALDEINADFILTAHTLDDSIETMIFNFFRGADLAGLQGIQNHGVIMRPLSIMTKDEIYAYANANQVPYREDASNATDVYTRNLIRNTILPTIEDHLPNVSGRLESTRQRLSRAARFHAQALDYLTERVVSSNQHGSFVSFSLLEELEFGGDFLYYWGRQYGFSETQLSQIYDTRQVGKLIESHDWIITVQREGYQLSSRNDIQEVMQISIESAEFSIEFGSVQISSHVLSTGTELLDQISIDDSLLVYPLTLRTWSDGDKIAFRSSPRQTKKLKKLFVDHKLSVHQKHQVPILVNGDGRLIWVIGLQRSTDFTQEDGYLLSAYHSVR